MGPSIVHARLMRRDPLSSPSSLLYQQLWHYTCALCDAFHPIPCHAMPCHTIPYHLPNAAHWQHKLTHALASRAAPAAPAPCFPRQQAHSRAPKPAWLLRQSWRGCTTVARCRRASWQSELNPSAHTFALSSHTLHCHWDARCHSATGQCVLMHPCLQPRHLPSSNQAPLLETCHHGDPPMPAVHACAPAGTACGRAALAQQRTATQHAALPC